MRRKFVYLFAISFTTTKIVHSFDTEEAVLDRVKNLEDDTKTAVKKFVQIAKPGDFIQVSEGEYIFRQAD